MTERKRRRLKIDAVYDIECAQWTDFVMGARLTADGTFELYSEHKSAKSRWNQEQMHSDILTSAGHTWAHAGGIYDHKWLLDAAARRGYRASISAAGPRIVTAQLGKLHLRDSWALVPVKLKALTASQTTHKEELDLPCVCGDNCGGYCAISRTMTKAHYQRACDYLRADCESLLESLTKIQQFGDENDIDLCATVGASAWRTAQRLLDLPDADLSPTEHEYIRRAYYGGRTQLLIPGELRNVYECDVSSMYPWCLSTVELPVGARQTVYGEDALAAFALQKPGVYSAVVDVPEMHLPPLPYRVKTRIAYPTGRLAGTWTQIELEYATQVGCKIVNIGQACIWQHTAKIFAPYMEKIFALRIKAGKKTAPGEWLKRLLVALSGKLGASPHKDRYFINPDHFMRCPGSEQCTSNGRDCGGCCADHCNKRCGAMSELSEHIWSEPFYHLDPCGHTQWAAYCTSAARVELHKQLVSERGGEDAVYCDTDGVESLIPRTRRVSPAIPAPMGEWENKGKWDVFIGIAPKTYYGWKQGKCEAKAKGLGAPADAPIEIGKLYRPKGVAGLRTGARHGALFTRASDLSIGRTVKSGVGDRILQRNGSTRPPTVDEAEQMK